MTTIDLYTNGNLGELETILIEKDSSNNIIFKLKLPTGEYGGIMDWIPFNETSDVNSLVYLYNVNLSFANRDYEEVIRLQEFYDQLISITSQVHPFCLPVLDALKQICQSALQHNNKLFIKFE